MKFFNNLFKKKNNSKYLFLFVFLIFAIMSHRIFFKKEKTVIIINKNKDMHWGFPMSRPPAPRMRNF